MPVEPLLGFVFLYTYAKLMEYGMPFYVAAGLFVVTSYIGEWLLSGLEFVSIMPLSVLLKLVASLVIFYLLKKNEDKIAAWLIFFGIGFIVLAIVL